MSGCSQAGHSPQSKSLSLPTVYEEPYAYFNLAQLDYSPVERFVSTHLASLTKHLRLPQSTENINIMQLVLPLG